MLVSAVKVIVKDVFCRSSPKPRVHSEARSNTLCGGGGQCLGLVFSVADKIALHIIRMPKIDVFLIFRHRRRVK
jgi:hypothetical protein